MFRVNSETRVGISPFASVSNLQRFVCDWRVAVEDFLECHHQQPSVSEQPDKAEESRQKYSFWSRLFGRKACSPPQRRPWSQRSVSQASQRHDGDDSSTESSTESTSCSHYDVSSVAGVPMSCTTSKSVVAEAFTDDENGDGQEGQPSLQLMTCESLKDADSQPSVVSKCTAVMAYDSNKAYESYRLQTVIDEARVVSEHSQEVCLVLVGHA